MAARWKWLFLRTSKRPWFRASLFSVLGVATALLALVLAPYIPDELPTKIGSDAVDNILGVIASSMLAVTTFSLSITVSAYGSATSNVTPRATSLLVEDSTTQNTLSTFIGSFIFSLVGIIALSTGLYGDKGRVILFVVTIAVIILIVYALLRWIDHLTGLGRVGETTARVEEAASRALCHRIKEPYLGGSPLPQDVNYQIGARPVYPNRIGYIQHLDMRALADLMSSAESRLYIVALPGGFVGPSHPLAWSVGLEDECDEAVRTAFVMGDKRTFERDPRFGISVLAEIASRALSPALNDQGTAIDVIGRGVRLLSGLAGSARQEATSNPEYPRIFVKGLNVDDLFDDFFTPIARDGAGMIEVNIRLQKGLAYLSGLGDTTIETVARQHAKWAWKRAEAALTFDEDRQRLKHTMLELKTWP